MCAYKMNCIADEESTVIIFSSSLKDSKNITGNTCKEQQQAATQKYAS